MEQVSGPKFCPRDEAIPWYMRWDLSLEHVKEIITLDR